MLIAAAAAPRAAPAAGFPWEAYAARPDEWYRGAEGARAAANVRSHQTVPGDRPKNLDTSAEPFGGDRRVVADAAAPPLWARFSEIGTDRPFFCGRDGLRKDRLDEIERERRNGYAWYGNGGVRVAERYAAWSPAHPGRAPGQRPGADAPP